MGGRERRARVEHRLGHLMLVIDKIKRVLTFPVDHFEEGWFEPWTTNVVKRLVQPGWVCYDVGANEGWYTTLFSLLAKAGGQVITFEPMTSATVKKLAVEIAEILDAAPVQGYDVALTNAVGAGVKRVQRVRTDAWTLQECADGGEGQYRYLDDIVRSDKLPPPNIIKIDVDGDEPRVLSGASAVIEAHRPVIVLEVAPDYNKLQGLDIEPSLRWLQGLGYKLCSDETGKEYDASQVQALVCAWSSINLICMP